MKKPSCEKFYVTESCVQCKTCEKVCPRANIHVKNILEFGTICEGCQSCVHNCPKGALKVRREKSDVRYRNKHITLGDIIEANNQK